MRLDKFLKISRVIKRRTISHDLAEAGKIKINNKVAKPSTFVKIGDVLTLNLGDRDFIIEVTNIREFANKTQADDLYVVKEERIKS